MGMGQIVVSADPGQERQLSCNCDISLTDLIVGPYLGILDTRNVGSCLGTFHVFIDPELGKISLQRNLFSLAHA